MFYIVSYDIPNDRKRNRVSKAMLNYGARVQYSVFECIIDDKLLEKMTAKLRKIISDEDSVRIYALCAKCEKVVTVLGRGEVTKDENVFII
ncbi:MAG: CRISPR-associated endonuclease Cas2 [Nitrospirae bacterium]|nr:CRISPR-associated endonuclease Cas2 [Nitrospirota bacterium]